MNCPNCQQPLREGALFCTRCGARTSQGGGASAKTAQTEGGASQPTLVGAGDVPAAPDPFVGRVLEGKYEIVAPLGAGGMGAVYLARRVLIGDEVAVKVLHSKFTGDEKLVERFRREARAAAQLHHPNVVTIHDYGEARGPEGFAYIVMELVRGESLRELLKREGRLDARRAVELMRGVCAGVGAAHRRGIVHRDIKPDNVIVSPADDDNPAERVKVVDFGIAKIRDMAAESTLTEAGSMVGTLFYMSPEQCKGEPLDSRADVYSLGAMLYEMLAGSPPFTAPSITSIILKHVNAPPPPLPEDAGVPVALAAAVMRSLAKDPEERPRDATEFAREIQAALTSDADAPAVSSQPAGASTPSAEGSTQSAEPFFPATARPVPVTPTHPAPVHPTPSPSTNPTAPDAAEREEVTVVRDSSAPPAQRPNAYAPAQSPGGYAPAHRPAPPHTRPPAPHAAPARRSRRSYAVGLLVVLLVVICGLAGVVGVVLYMRPARRTVAVNARPSPTTATPTPNFASPTPTPTPVDVAEVSKEVGDALEGWADSTRERDIEAHMSHYADRLETYYRKQNVPAAQVRADRESAFVRYDDMKVKLDNIQVTPDPTGNRATAAFDKTWEFDSPDKNTKGSVRQQLTLVRNGTRWLIVGEKDLQVYYTNSEDYTQ
jgi:serine/threonine protein kinase/ketosteroid isomerase-like protein